MAKSALSQINRSLKLATREIERSSRESQQRKTQALRQQEVAFRAEQAALKKAQRSSEIEKKSLEKEAKLAHVAYREAEVDALNLEIEEIAEDFSTLLESTLDVDDFVDLESLRQTVVHPPFHRFDLESPLPPPLKGQLLQEEPQLKNIAPPKLLVTLLGEGWREKKLNEAKRKHEKRYQRWRRKNASVLAEYERKVQEREGNELKRVRELEVAQKLYQQQCDERELLVEKQNEELDGLIANLGYGTKDAIEEYISIVLFNSQYPEHFKVNYDYEFNGADAELLLNVLIPRPDSLNSIKSYKYLKTKDEIARSSLSQKAQKDRYLSIVCQVTLRTVHEVFEADRRGIIQTISIQVGTQGPDPATGQEKFLPFSALGTSRETFLEIELANVVPQLTLEHLGATVSKKPFELIAIDPRGISKTK